MTDKKKLQLGMNPSTASHRLVKDILWSLLQETNKNNCCKCKQPMSRETFSIEHVVPWLDSENPSLTFFDLNNISFSHLSCNISDARNPRKYSTEEERKAAKRKWDNSQPYDSEVRRAQYLRTGK